MNLAAKNAKSAKKAWPMVRLGDVCEIKNGYTPKAVELCESGDVPYFRISAMNFIGNEKEMQRPTAWLVGRHRCFKSGSIIFPKNGGAVYTGKVRLLVRDSIVDLNTGVCSPIVNINSDYLYYWITAYDIRSAIVEGTIPFVDFAKLSDAEFPLPPLPVQREIVARLEKELGEADALAAKYKEIAENAAAEFKAELDETFKNVEGEKVRLGDVCETGAGGTPLRTVKEFYEGGDIPWLRSGEVCRRDIDETEMFITKAGMDNSSAKLFPTNTVVVAMYGATAGQVGILRIESTTNQAVCAILPSDTYHPEFMYYQLVQMKDKMVAQAQGGAQPNISQIKIKNLEIEFPPLEAQRAIVAKLDAAKEKCEKLKAAAERGLRAAEDLRKSIFAEAFEQ